MNEYVFPGADASCLLWWVVGQVEAAGFEVKSIDVLGIHYSATIWRWYLTADSVILMHETDYNCQTLVLHYSLQCAVMHYFNV